MSFRKYLVKIGKRIKSGREFSKTKFSKTNKKRVIPWSSIVLGLFILIYLSFKTFIVASINGVPITRFEVIKLLERQGGEQALDNLITRRLILQEAKNKGLSMSQPEIDEKLSQLNTYLEGQGTNLEAALEFQKQTKEELISDITVQGLVEKILQEDLTVSDEEINSYFKENRDFYAEDATLADSSQQIREQLKSDKLTAKFQEWLDKARSEASIRRFLNY